MLGNFLKYRSVCRLLFKTFKICFILMRNVTLSSKSIMSVPALKGLTLNPANCRLLELMLTNPYVFYSLSRGLDCDRTEML